MNTEFYRNFIAMVEAGGMNRAAREIHVAQPALTRQLQVLEGIWRCAGETPERAPHLGTHGGRLDSIPPGPADMRSRPHSPCGNL